MDAQDCRALLRHRVCVVASARAICGADLAKLRAALLDDVGDAERAADLDQLAARDDHFLLRGNRGEKEQRAGGVVVRQDRGLTSEERRAERRQVLVSRAALTMLEIEFEI